MASGPPESSWGPHPPSHLHSKGIGAAGRAWAQADSSRWLCYQLWILLVTPPPTHLVYMRDTMSGFQMLTESKTYFLGHSPNRLRW